MVEKEIIGNSILIENETNLSLEKVPESQEILGRREKSIQVHQNAENYLANTREEIPKDFDTARTTIHSLIETGQTAIKELLEFAQESGHPRAFEVLGNLIKTVGEQTERLLNVHKTVQELRNDPNNNNPINVNIDQRSGPNVSVQTTMEDLIKTIKNTKK